MKQKTRTRVLSWLLSLVMILSLVPGMGLTAYAAGEKAYAAYDVTTETNKTKSGGDLTALQVTFKGKKWYIIKDNSSSATSGTVTLLSADTTFGTKRFDNGDYSNKYSTSQVKAYLDSMTGTNGAFADVADAIETVNLTTNKYKSTEEYETVNGVKLYLLSTEDANSLPTNVRKAGFSGEDIEYNEWWLRSPGSNDGVAASVYGTNGNVAGNGLDVYYALGVRPALQLDLSKVTFDSATKTFSVVSSTVAVTGMTLDQTTATLNVGAVQKLTATVEPDNATDKTVKWSVGGNDAGAVKLFTDEACNTEVGTDATETLTVYAKGISAGSATVTATSNADSTKTASCNVTVHAHSFAYSVIGDTITATCEADGCDLPEVGDKHTATLTIAAPQHTAVGDGKSADAQITDANNIKGDAAVSYYATDASSNKTGDALTEAPTAAGTYWAEITLGTGDNTATAHVVYTITNPDYKVTLPTDLVGGTVAADKTSAKYDEAVTLTITPDNGFTIKTVKYNDTAITANEGVYSFPMPASDVTVSVTFEGAPFDVTISDTISGGTVTVASTLENGKAKAGSEVTLTVTPATGYQIGTVKYNETTITPSEGVYKFIMPAEAVTVSATFAGHDTTATLSVAGDKGPNCTAKLLHDDFTDVTDDKPLTKKGGEQFILLVNRDEGYDFTVTYGTANSPVTLTEFTEEEYKAYVDYANENNLAVSSDMVLARVTMPGVSGENVTLTVNFSKLKTFTVLYQPSEENTTAAWCKFAYTEAGSLVTDSAQMKSDTVMGDGTKAYSLKVTAAFNPEKVAFVTDESNLESAAMGDATVSQNTDSWNEITGGYYVVIGGDAKTVVAAFVTDTNSIKVYNGNSNRKDMGQTVKDTSGVTYRLAIVTESEGTVTPGAVTAPKAPANSDETIQFAGWWGFEYDGDGKEKVYKAGENVPVSKNTTFIDRWEPKQLTVTLNLNGGTGVTTNQPVTYGETMEKPTDPTRYSFAFEGWRVNKTVTEGGQLFVKGTPFVDLENTKITADMGLTAQWKHVHTYTCYRVTLFSKEYHGYDSSVHVALCGCGNSRLEAHAFDSNGKCACGYEKPGPKPVKLEVSYVRFENSTYTTRFKGLPQPMKPHLGEEVTISAPNIFGEGSQFSKWQFSTDDGETWTDLAAAERVSFIIPCDNLKLRGLYVNTVTNPQVELSASKYKQDVEVKGYTVKADNILFQMHYKLPDGYTFVDAGVRVGDNDGIVYYELKEKTHEMSTGGKAASWVGATFLSFFTGGPEIPETSATERYYEVRKSNAVADLGAAKVAKYMYENEPVSAKAAPILYEAKATTKGSSGSVATIPPIGLAQSENQNNWIYGIGWLRYTTPQGEVETIYTEALPATLKNMPTNTVTKQGS